MNNPPAEGENLHAFPDEQVTSSADLATSSGLEDLVAQIKETARQYMQLIDFQAQKHFQALMRVNGL